MTDSDEVYALFDQFGTDLLYGSVGVGGEQDGGLRIA